MRRIAYESVRADGVDINLSPLIDCVFLLLLFFVVSTVFVTDTGVEVQKPRAASAADVERNSLRIALTPDGRIVYGGREIALNSVRGLVAQQMQAKPVPVVVLADQASRTGRLIDVVDECKLAGARQVSVAATRE